MVAEDQDGSFNRRQNSGPTSIARDESGKKSGRLTGAWGRHKPAKDSSVVHFAHFPRSLQPHSRRVPIPRWVRPGPIRPSTHASLRGDRAGVMASLLLLWIRTIARAPTEPLRRVTNR